MSDTWQIIEVARRMGFDHLFPWKKEEHIKRIWKEYIQFHDNDKHRMAPYEELRENPGIIWPFVNGSSTKWRYNVNRDPAASGNGKFDFYGKSDHRADLWFRPYEPPAEAPDEEYPFWLTTGRVLEHWHTGSMTRRVPSLHQSVPQAFVELHPDDAEQFDIRNDDPVRLVSRRGEIVLPASINERGRPDRGSVFVPFFEESKLINELTLDAYCPLSKQPDYKKCAVRVEKP